MTNKFSYLVWHYGPQKLYQIIMISPTCPCLCNEFVRILWFSCNPQLSGRPSGGELYRRASNGNINHPITCVAQLGAQCMEQSTLIEISLHWENSGHSKHFATNIPKYPFLF